MKFNKRNIPFIFLLSLFTLLQCKSPKEPDILENQDGSITVRINAPAQLAQKPAYLNLHEQGVNVYDPTMVPLATNRFVLDQNGDGSVVLADTAVGGEIYQITGAINVAGATYFAPEAGDYLFRKNCRCGCGFYQEHSFI